MSQDKKITIIAECCQNHKGDLKILKDMIWAAADAGADYVKIQSMLADDLTHRECFEKGLVEGGKTKVIKRPYQEEYNRLKPLDLENDAHLWFIEECKKAGIKPLTTVFARSRVPFLSSLPLEEIKVASYDCGSYPLIRELKRKFKHLYISTGASYDEEIEKTAGILKGCSFTLLHCITIYPTPMNVLNLARIDYLRQFTPSAGFSDHTLVEKDGIMASVAAIYYGADVVERHYTVLPREDTKDGPISINPEELKTLVQLSRMNHDELAIYVRDNIPGYEQCIGTARRELTDTELSNRNYYRGRFASKIGNRVVYNWEKV